MADYLLDTHACLFALAAPKKLGKKARRLLEQADAEGSIVWVPAAATAEIVLLRELGRTEIGVPALTRAFAETAWRFHSTSRRSTSSARSLPFATQLIG